ncbi:MAG: PHP domain-containing protein [Armatimonadota bacterium]
MSMSIAYDCHTHTTFSDGRNSLIENVRAAEACGLECVAITDHFFEPGEWFEQMLSGVEAARQWSSTKVLAGAEATILNLDGETTIDDWHAGALDFVLADFGERTQGVAAEPPATKARLIDNVVTAMVNACKNPVVNAIAHPFNLGRVPGDLHLSDIPRASLEIVGQALAESETAFEIMNQMYWWWPEEPVHRFMSGYVELVRVLRDTDAKFVLGSDAHSAGAVGNLTWALHVVEQAEVPPAQIVNLARLGPQ